MLFEVGLKGFSCINFFIINFNVKFGYFFKELMNR